MKTTRLDVWSLLIYYFSEKLTVSVKQVKIPLSFENGIFGAADRT